ncbi:hypothetical protein KC340_g994 [Hortaea werneckii]|nr:hypothetical protein KC342_g11924 [Hortaea werneckii]KAI7240906.1 hypothetical protein KC365_g3648 [Hortaea werneckii]KAI7338266.1 hypothetical protein KC340_g994 [Hortaea werneckii]KAI7407055.1 hypothetical protein KC328_g654 [Hortaea werneckii]
MRLINTETLDMREFLPAYIPRYAILSHRWQEEEVSFKQYIKRHKYPEIQQLKGFAKIVQLCRIARERQMEWAWIDTCCIDSRSSAELSEAINSMWQWYADADECYIYLCDVHMQDDFSDVLAQVEKSEWFTRGWTLQELIAPRYRVFFTSAWMAIGVVSLWQDARASEKSSRDLSGVEESSKSLQHVVSRTSKVPSSYLLVRDVVSSSIGERISWSASRQTSRPEDVAYSLMGLLEVNMPMLYGEGKEKAFVRLQLELIKKSRDTSLLAWQLPLIKKETSDRHGSGLLASSPARFANFGRSLSRNYDYWGFTMVGRELSLAPYKMTNRGLHLHVGAYRILSHNMLGSLILWCVPLSVDGTAIILEHPVACDPTSSPVPARRTSLIAWDVLNREGRLPLKGAQTAISIEKYLDSSGSLVRLAKGQRGKLEPCEFCIEQDYL